MLTLMKEQGLSVDTRDDDGWTALHHAMFLQNGDSVQALLEFGANPNLPNFSGKTPLHMAGCHRDEIGGFLSHRRIPKSIVPKSLCCVESVQQLLRQGTDATAVDRAGNLPFFRVAARESNVTATFLMVEAAASQGLFDAARCKKSKKQAATKRKNQSSNVGGEKRIKKDSPY